MSFTNTPPKWDAQGAEPSADLQTNGFSAGYKPPAQYFNYLFNKYTACIKELQELAAAQGVTLEETNTSLTTHTSDKDNPHGVTKTQVGLGNVDNTSDANKPVSTAMQTELDKKASTVDLSKVATSGNYNDLSNKPTIPSAVTVDAAMSSTSTNPVQNKVVNKALGAKANNADLTSHTGNKSNPHGVTKSQVGLGNVPNVATNDQTPTFTAATTRANIASGEKLSVILGKIAKFFTDLKTVAFSGSYNDLSNKPTIPDTSTFALKSKYGDTTINVGRKAGTTVGTYSTAEGNSTTASGYCSHAEGEETTASQYYAHAEGIEAIASGYASHAAGVGTIALDLQHAGGRCNNTNTAKAVDLDSNTGGTLFVLGNGTGGSTSNAFRVTDDGSTVAKKAYSTSGADYAEYFEWEDENEESEDRRGLFVTVDGEKIKVAKPNDYIVGVVSAMPSVIGNHDEEWMGRYILDEYGAFINEKYEYEREEYTREVDGNGMPIKKKVTKTGIKWKENPEYDSTKPYTPRAERPEWDAVGMLGVLNVRDDGTCQVNGFCKVADGGIATTSDKGYRVVKRVTDNIVKIIFK